MKNLFILLTVLFVVGCAWTTPIMINTTDISKIDFSENMSKGEACETSIFGLLGPFGSRSVIMAAKNAGISQVRYTEYTTKWNVITSNSCVTVYGN